MGMVPDASTIDSGWIYYDFYLFYTALPIGGCKAQAIALTVSGSAPGVQTLFIEPGSPWESGYVERVNGKRRDELLNGEIFETCWEATLLAHADGAPTTRFARTVH